MFGGLKKLFSKDQAPAAGQIQEDQRLRIAACALLLEMAHADDEFSQVERQQIERVVTHHFALDHAGAKQLMEAAEEARRQAIDLHEFTAEITRRYDEGQRMVLAELLWRVVLADGIQSQHEAQLARKLGSLLELRPGYLSEARRRAGGS
jgi:uncharacterized tellurite resistance protein B-like protein